MALYPTIDFATPFATATSAADATYSLQVPQGTADVYQGTIVAAGFLTVYVHGIRADFAHGDITMFNLRALTSNNVESAALLVKEIWDPAFTVIAGTVLDCQNLIVEHAAVTLSMASGHREFVPRATVYYGASGAVALAVKPEDRGDTNDNGIYAVFRVPPGQAAFVQAWGFVDAAAQARGIDGLTLISEQPIHAVAGSVIQMLSFVD